MKKIAINSPKYGRKYVLVDDEDYDKLKKLTWHLSKGRMSFYANTNAKKKEGGYYQLGMQRLIMKVKSKHIHIDHIDFDGLNNQKRNLRKCTRSQNAMNGRSFGSSKYLGVSLAISKRNHGKTTYKYWRSSIGGRKGTKHLGLFPYTEQGEIEAAKAYDKQATKRYKKFANLNFKQKTNGKHGVNQRAAA